MQEQTTSQEKSTLQRVILPVGIFIGAIAAIAWITQYIPNWRGENKTKPPLGAGKENKIRFYAPILQKGENGSTQVGFDRAPDAANQLFAVWNLSDPSYELEFEKGDAGFYDYLVINESDKTAEVILTYKSCGCSDVKVCVLPVSVAKEHIQRVHLKSTWTHVPTAEEEKGYNWKEMQSMPPTAVSLPAGQAGLVRLSWKGEKAKEQRETLKVTVVTQPEGESREGKMMDLWARVVLVPPLQFYPPVLDVGDVPEGSSVEKEYWCWSPTRENFMLTFPENKTNPCIQCKAELLDEKQRETLQKEILPKDIKSKVLSGYKVTVTVKEKVGDKMLDMGFLYKQVPANANIENLPQTPAPYLRGFIPSDIRVGQDKNNSFIPLGTFSSKEGIRDKKYTLFTDKGVKLKYLNSEPPLMSVKLTEKETKGDQTAWQLNLVLPGGVVSGPMENSFVQFESTRPGGETRFVRIPVKGIGQGSSF